jgi:hypothetical protein
MSSIEIGGEKIGMKLGFLAGRRFVPHAHDESRSSCFDGCHCVEPNHKRHVGSEPVRELSCALEGWAGCGLLWLAQIIPAQPNQGYNFWPVKFYFDFHFHFPVFST